MNPEDVRDLISQIKSQHEEQIANMVQHFQKMLETVTFPVPTQRVLNHSLHLIQNPNYGRTIGIVLKHFVKRTTFLKFDNPWCFPQIKIVLFSKPLTILLHDKLFL